MSERNYFVHPNAICESESIGKDTRIWAFAHILKNVTIGEDCNICDYVFIENGVIIGNRVTIKNGISVWHGVTLEDDVFLGPNCVLTNDMYPRSKGYEAPVINTVIKKGASVGANATIICGVTLGRFCMIGAGAVVTKDVPDYAVVMGNPAKFKYWISKNAEKLIFDKDMLASDSKGFKYKLVKNKDSQYDKVIEI